MNNNIRDIMTPSPHTIQIGASVIDAAQIMRKSGIGEVIVLEGTRLFGIVTDRDIVVRAVAEGRNPESTLVSDICDASSRPCWRPTASGRRYGRCARRRSAACRWWTSPAR